MRKVGISKFFFAAAIAALSIGASRAKADSVVFANFLQNNPGDTPWTFSDAGSGSTFNIAGQESVFFVSTGGVNQVLNFNGTAEVTLNSLVTGQAVVNGDEVSQGVSGTLEFTSGASNVLTVDFTGAITGILGSHSSDSNADTSIEGQAVAFSSDFAVAPFIPTFSFSIALTQSPVLAVADDGYLATFNASATGNFATGSGAGATPTPLPASLWGSLGMMGALGGAGAMFRRRRRLA